MDQRLLPGRNQDLPVPDAPIGALWEFEPFLAEVLDDSIGAASLPENAEGETHCALNALVGVQDDPAQFIMEEAHCQRNAQFSFASLI